MPRSRTRSPSMLLQRLLPDAPQAPFGLALAGLVDEEQPREMAAELLPRHGRAGSRRRLPAVIACIDSAAACSSASIAGPNPRRSRASPASADAARLDGVVRLRQPLEDRDPRRRWSVRPRALSQSARRRRSRRPQDWSSWPPYSVILDRVQYYLWYNFRMAGQSRTACGNARNGRRARRFPTSPRDCSPSAASRTSPWRRSPRRRTWPR